MRSLRGRVSRYIMRQSRRLTKLFVRDCAHRLPKIPACFALLALAAFAAITSAQDGAFARAASVLQPQAYVSLEPVPRGRAFEVAVVAKITPGFHVNAH